jgi:hypothetical protein
MKDGAVLTISAFSCAVLEQDIERAYLDRLLIQVTGLGIGSGTEEEIRTRCRQLVRSGRAAGFSTELELAAYVMCGFAFGTEFDERPPYREILRNSALTASSKTKILMMLLDGLDSNESDDSEVEVGKEER